MCIYKIGPSYNRLQFLKNTTSWGRGGRWTQPKLYTEKFIYYGSIVTSMDELVESCPLCNATGYEATEMIVLGKMTLAEAADRFDVTIEEAWAHLMYHEHGLKPIIDIEDKLKRLVWTMDDYIKEYMITQKPKGGNVKALVTMVREMRNLLSTLGEVRGTINKGTQNQINIENMQINNMNRLIDTVMSDLCPECQLKILNEIDGSKIVEAEVVRDGPHRKIESRSSCKKQTS